MTFSLNSRINVCINCAGSAVIFFRRSGVIRETQVKCVIFDTFLGEFFISLHHQCDKLHSKLQGSINTWNSWISYKHFFKHKIGHRRASYFFALAQNSSCFFHQHSHHLQTLVAHFYFHHVSAIKLLSPCLTDKVLCFGSWVLHTFLCPSIQYKSVLYFFNPELCRLF